MPLKACIFSFICEIKIDINLQKKLDDMLMNLHSFLYKFQLILSMRLQYNLIENIIKIKIKVIMANE